jgi:hypothetical protein
MGRSTARRVALGAVMVGVVTAVGLAPAWAPHVAQLRVTPAQVRAGDTVTVFGT